MNHLTKLILLIFLLNSCALISQSSNVGRLEKGLSKAALLKDYDTFRSIYESANAGLYKYRTKAAVDSLFDLQRTCIKEGLTHRDFFKILWEVIDFTGSSHNELGYPARLDKRLSKRAIFFPIPLIYIEGKLYTNKTVEEVPLGSEIQTINGVEAQNLIDQLTLYNTSTDGFNKSGKYAFINTDWLAFHLYLVLGAQAEFEVLAALPGQSTKSTKIAAVKYHDFALNFHFRHSKQLEEQLASTYKYTRLDSLSAAKLDVHSFVIGPPNSEEYADYKIFLDSVFLDLKNREVKHLIVDIRKNGGGIDPNDLLLYSYLTQRPFRENISAFTLFNDVPFAAYYLPDYKGEQAELEEELKAEHNLLKEGKYFQNDTYNPLWQPNELAFQNQIYLLIDAEVASAGSLFASLVKSEQRAIVIGEETLGGYYGHTGHIPVAYELPNSKFVLGFSIVDLEQDVVSLPDQAKGRGILPDIPIHLTYDDFMAQKDGVMARVLEYIVQQH